MVGYCNVDGVDVAMSDYMLKSVVIHCQLKTAENTSMTNPGEYVQQLTLPRRQIVLFNLIERKVAKMTTNCFG